MNVALYASELFLVRHTTAFKQIMPINPEYIISPNGTV